MNSLFSNILSASFHGSIVIAVVLVLRLILKKAPKKYICLLWLLAGLRLLMPFEIESRLSLQPETAPAAQTRQQADILLFLPELGDAPVLPAENEVPSGTRQTADSTPLSQPDSPARAASDTGTSAAGQIEKAASAFDWAALIPWLWLTVALGFGVYGLVSFLRLKRSVREAVKTAGGVWEQAGLETAFILGFVRPRIYLPMGLPWEARRHILAHERTHLKRGDHWVKLLGFAVLAIHWFNPLVWVAYALLCRDIEMACDQRVVRYMSLEERKRYSNALLSCSTSRAHFAACPVAFGEVSVKQRILSVLNYRRPGFWISLVSIAAIVFVAVCLLTTPAGAGEPAAGDNSPGETAPAGEAASPVPETGFAAGLSVEEALDACDRAIQELKDRDSYYIQIQRHVVSESESYSSSEITSEVRRYARNSIAVAETRLGSLEEPYTSGTLRYDGQYADYNGGKWVWYGQSETDADAWLDLYTTLNKTVTFPEGTGVTGGDTVCFAAEWTQTTPLMVTQTYSGTYTYTLCDDGTLAAIRRDYVYLAGDGKEVSYTEILTVMDEPAGETNARIQAAADEAITEEEYEIYSRTRNSVTGHPSNTTDYDLNYALGSSRAGWYFLNGTWFVKFGAENVTNTGVRLVFEENGPYDGGTALNGTVTAGGSYFIERLVDGRWEDVPLAAEAFTPMEEKKAAVGTDISINWENNYGSLPGGFYRIGNYYTFTSTAGETDTQICYAKFRLYDPGMDVLLGKCHTALDALLNGGSYHIYSFDYMTLQENDCCVSSEVWKSGKDYLEVTKYPLREDTSKLKSSKGSMWRDGKYYGLEWAGEPAVSDVNSWWVGVDGYLDGSNFTLWTMGLEWYESSVAEVWEDGDEVHILSLYDYDDRYQYTELTCRFDSRGNLAGIAKAYLPTRNCSEKDKVIDEEMVVLDTPAAEIAGLISSQNISQPAAFSYAEDVKQRPDAATGGFRNTTAKPIHSMADAIALAEKECTLPLLDGKDRYFQVSACYDESEGMWKVELFWQQDSSCYQAVYLNDQGITQRIVTSALDS